MADIFETYRDPAIGEIPIDQRQQEVAYAQTLPRREDLAAKTGHTPYTWTEAGPSDIGGRTRVLVFDAADPNIILTGGVSGGIWKSTDGGATWVLKTTVAEHPGVTALVQDPRPGHTHVWYYGSGEWFGDRTPSDRGFTAIYNGAGLYKSEDNGETWTLLPATADANPTGCCDPFDYVHRMVMHPTTGTLFVATNTHGIYRSDDGGASFSRVLGSGNGAYTWTEVAVSSTGTLVATLSAAGPQPGIYRSTNDGQTWQRITPSTFPTSHGRSVVTFAPSNPDAAYVMTYAGPNRGDGREDIRLHKLNVAQGTGQDRTASLPNFPGNPAFGPSMRSINNFTMALGVKPDDEDFVLIAGITMFRSDTGFRTRLTDRNDHIGGYRDFNQGGLFPNHWVDNHAFVFHPNNPNELWCANDAGVSVMDDVTGPAVWRTTDTSYNVVQYYGIEIAEAAGDGRIVGGLQDTGSIIFVDQREQERDADFSASKRLTAGDGGYFYLGERHLYGSWNANGIGRWTVSDFSPTQFSNVVTFPLPRSMSGQRFINPFAVDPNAEDVIYYPAGNALWRNTNGTAFSPTSGDWQNVAQVPSGFFIRAIAVSQTPAHRVYLGANNFNAQPKTYRWDNANTGAATLQEVSIPNAPFGAYIHNIAIHPQNADEILVTMSNYNIIGLYHSTDGGQSYTAVEGNLHGGGQGPSLRAATVVPAADGSTTYFLGTSTGLFSTTTLDGMNTEWVQEAFDRLGNIVVEHITSRASDARVAVGTHGRGAFLGDPSNPTRTTTPEQPAAFALAQNYPNPFNPTTQIGFTLHQPGRVTLTVSDMQGRQVAMLLSDAPHATGTHEATFNGTGLPSGRYLYQLLLHTASGATYRQSQTLSLVK
ncbi:MAG: exo-alpha-sialidase [Rhodothermales bacterium]